MFNTSSSCSSSKQNISCSSVVMEAASAVSILLVVKALSALKVLSGLKASAACAAAFCISFVAVVAGTGSRHAESAKLRQALRPLNANAATSWARAAISAVGKVPNQILVFLLGSLISHTHLSKFLLLTPLNTGWRVSLNFFLPARFFGVLAASRTSSLKTGIS
ncbi:hypothetical protein KIW84_013023 [Lathyrus oleraceus]|uniref:Uncharacterized protein n=1 Tax=Pisum sativum TaxID=3888 RepID=A0A9D5GX57_PEA|nr:hypothetical protein KIW84_013023 [Pisum sativum]